MDSFLGIFRGNPSSEFSEGAVPRKFPMTVPKNISSELPRIGPSENPSVYSEEISDELVVLGVSSEICFLGIPSEISEEIPKKKEFPRSYFRGFISVFRRHTDDFFPQYVVVFL
ncbi:hypothetical protein DY000_02010980 [Brassica cretica]|uniref:Uncharacterized protein n=1 Tax=Brassica cretica TaxID=69181 RepID=A0ABQ7CSX3_BRACR|nr:hypothetical protein DY000_02010980 [Brassica cretica]